MDQRRLNLELLISVHVVFIEVEFDLSEEGTMEACETGCNSVDYVQLEYNIDGGGWETPADASFCGGRMCGCFGNSI